MVNEPRRQTEHAVEVLSALQERGADLSQPRHTIHFFYGGDFQGLGTALKDLGFEVSSTVDNDGVVAEQIAVLDEEWRIGTLTRLSELANQFDSEYDGWEAAMTPQAKQ